MLIDWTQSDRAPAGQRDPRLSAAPEQRSQCKNGRAHRFHQLVGRERPVDVARIQDDAIAVDAFALDAHLREQRHHRPHVVQAWHVGDTQRLRGQQRRAENRQRGILRPRHANFSVQWRSAFDDELVHPLAVSARQCRSFHPRASSAIASDARSAAEPATTARQTKGGASESPKNPYRKPSII